MNNMNMVFFVVYWPQFQRIEPISLSLHPEFFEQILGLFCPSNRFSLKG